MSTALLTVDRPTIAEPEALPSLRTLARQTSVIIVAHNSGEFLHNCIASIRRAEPQVEIVLVDSASTDGAVDGVQVQFPSVRVERSEQNLGYAGGNNLGAQAASGAYLAFLNPDTIVEPGWLEALVSPLVEDPAIGLVTPQVLLADDPERINAAGLHVHVSGISMCRGLGAERSAFADAGEVAAVSGSAFAVRKDLFQALGGFDEAFFLYMEDVDLSWRVHLAGYRCTYVPRPVVRHEYTMVLGSRKTFYEERNRFLMLLKCLRWPTLLLLVPILLLAEAITWGYLLLWQRRDGKTKLQAYGWIVRHWGQVMQSRQQTQATRRIKDRDLLALCTHKLAFGQMAEGWIADLASTILDPVFFVLRWLALALVRW